MKEGNKEIGSVSNCASGTSSDGASANKSGGDEQ